jgi:hypothetical protein
MSRKLRITVHDALVYGSGVWVALKTLAHLELIIQSIEQISHMSELNGAQVPEPSMMVLFGSGLLVFHFSLERCSENRLG